MKPWGVTIQLKAILQYFCVIVFIMHYKVFQLYGLNPSVWTFKWTEAIEKKSEDFFVFFSAYQSLYVPAGTPPPQSVPMPVIQQQPDVILRQEMAVAPGKQTICAVFQFFLTECFLAIHCGGLRPI